MIVRYGQLFFNYYTGITYQKLVLPFSFSVKPETEYDIMSAGLLNDPCHGSI
jgi:hypothetical protein